jgi:hypothetical protein
MKFTIVTLQIVITTKKWKEYQRNGEMEGRKEV